VAHCGRATEIDPTIARCQAGERAAFSLLYREHVARVYRVCCALIGDAREAEDATQVTFAEAFRHLYRYNGSSRVSTWLCGIAVRIAANRRRSLQRHRRLVAAVEEESRSHVSAGLSPERDAAARERLRQLQAAVEVLAEPKRTAFILHHVRGLELPEVADIMGASVQTTFARAKSARREVAARLDAMKWGGGGPP
jgi:RNA polymerase sigma-70 factor (ECF subfamily)